MTPLLLLLWLFICTQSCFALSVTSESKPLRFFIGGLGYCGSRLALRLREEFPSCEIAGCVRSQTRKDSMMENEPGTRVHVLDLDQNYHGLDETGLADLAQATHVVQTIAPIADFDRDPLLALHSATLQESKNLQWVGYLSSTGVYGNYDGEWVDESSELRCQDAKSLARIEAETEWRQLEDARRQHVDEPSTRVDCFRCGGIYGPGRGPLFSSALSKPPPEEDDADAAPKYVNRILVDDICGAIVAAVLATVDSKDAGKIYNLVDDDPAPRRDVLAEARKLAGVTTTEEDKSDATATATEPQGRRRAASRNTGNKRCKNQLLRDDYQWEQRAPTYREGLAYLLKQQELAL